MYTVLFIKTLLTKKSFKLFVFSTVVLVLFIIVNRTLKEKTADSLESVSSLKLVPNTVHFIIFNQTNLDFTTFVSVTSALKIQRPNNVIIHCDCVKFEGHYWKLLTDTAKKLLIPLQVSYFPKPTHVYGQALSSIYHSADVARIQILMKYGGIYLDIDVLVLKPLNDFFKYEMTIGWPHNENIGSQVLIAKKGARFLKRWLNGYRRYRPRAWYYNAGQFPTEQILYKHPELAYRVPLLFGVHNLLDKLYSNNTWSEWREYYTIHLLSHHSPAPKGLNETTIKTYSPPFGEIARWILYGLEPRLKSIQDFQYVSTTFPPDYIQ